MKPSWQMQDNARPQATYNHHNTNNASQSNSFAYVAGTLLTLLIYWMLKGENGFLQDIGAILLLVVSVLLILRQPYWGVVLTMFSLSLTEILYDHRYTQYYLLAVGALTVGSNLLRVFSPYRSQHLDSRTSVKPVIYVWAFLFVFWTFISNPQAAIFLGNRIWIVTLVQLLLLTWLAGQLFDTPEKHRFLMRAFILATSISAVVALQETYIGESFGESVRAKGLSGGANTTVRLFVYALLMLAYLLRSTKMRPGKIFGIVGIVIMAAGVVATVSRSGFLLLVIALAMIFWDELTSRIHPGMVWAFLGILFVIIYWIPDSYWQFMIRDASISVMEGTDTMGFRYLLWQAAWKIWQGAPLTGVGIGQFSYFAPHYGVPPFGDNFLSVGAHSIYFALLAENGIVGFIFYIAMMLTALSLLARVARSGHSEWSALARTWLCILVLIIVGGITKQDHYDKFPWLIPGLSLATYRAYVLEKRKIE